MLCFLVPIVCLLVHSTAADMKIRLAGNGSTGCSGRVEILTNNMWGTVCDDNWDISDAEVACRQLGCGTPLRVTETRVFGPGTGDIWLDDVQCSGTESSLTNCGHNGIGTHNCGHNEDAGVICSDMEIRLAGNGSTWCSGRVEIMTNNMWGTVCDDSWDIRDAEVACRQLGCGTPLMVTETRVFGPGTGHIWLDDVHCSGTESSLTNCEHSEIGIHNCGHNEDAGVICSDMEIRLAGNGSTGCSGRVEIMTKNTWGTVCDDSWDISDAEVACRQLGCGTPLMATGTRAFGPGTGDIWLDDVHCSGTESSLTNCQHSEIGIHNCGHNEDAGVICSGIFQQINISLTSPNGGLAWAPEDAEVTRGYSFVFTCSINSSYPDGRFSLIFFSDSKVNYTKPAVNLSASFTFPLADTEHQGNYSCLYELSLFGQTFSSMETAPITVIIKSPSLLLLVSSVGGGSLLLLVLLVLLVVCLVCRRQQRARTEQPLVILTTTTASVRNLYGGGADEDEDQDYENVEPMYLKKKHGEQPGDAEDAESDDDYNNIETDVRNMKAAQVGYSVEINRKEEETSDEGEDYENVSQISNNDYVDIETHMIQVDRSAENSGGEGETSDEGDDYENVSQISSNDYEDIETDGIQVGRSAENRREEGETSEEGEDYENVSEMPQVQRFYRKV